MGICSTQLAGGRIKILQKAGRCWRSAAKEKGRENHGGRVRYKKQVCFTSQARQVEREQDSVFAGQSEKKGV
jgi:hypothetical protein